MQSDSSQEIVFEINGERYEAPVDPMPVKRSTLTEGHLIVEHSSCSYAIYLDLRPDSPRQGEYIAHEITEDKRYFVLFTPVGWAVNDRNEGREYMLFGPGADGYRLARESADELNEGVV